jgi:hypothetical protein
MEKLLFAILLLAALAGIPGASGDARIEWAIAFHDGGRMRAELKIEPSGRVDWKILLRGPILHLTGSGQSCLSHWGPCHA